MHAQWISGLQTHRPTLPRYTAKDTLLERQKLAKKEHIRLGVKGSSLFSSLSYFKCDPYFLDCRLSVPSSHGHAAEDGCVCSPCHFFRYGVAHVFLLGLLMDFWNQWLPSSKRRKKERPAGPRRLYQLPKEVVAQIAARASHIMHTYLFKKVYTDITKYGSASVHVVSSGTGYCRPLCFAEAHLAYTLQTVEAICCLPSRLPSCRHRSRWLMEDWLAFTETFSLYLLHDLEWQPDQDGIRQVFEEMWSNLRAGTLYFLRYEEGQHTAHRIRAAQEALTKYGALAEQTFAGEVICTFKLHIAAWHLPDQVRCCGPSFFCLEFWIERMVQLLKRLIKYRSTKSPEKVYVNDELLRRTCMRLLHCSETSEAAMLSLQEAVATAKRRRCKRSQGRAPAGDFEAAGGDDDRVFGAGKPLDAEETNEVMPLGYAGVGELTGLPYLLYHQADLQDDGWPTHPVLGAGYGRKEAIMRGLGLPVDGTVVADRQVCEVRLRKFLRGRALVGDVLTCAQHTGQGKKDNRWCLLKYHVVDEGADRGHDRYYVGDLQYIVRARLSTADGTGICSTCTVQARDLYLGVTDVYDCSTPYTPGCREADEVLNRAPEFFRVDGVHHRSPAYTGRYVVDIDAMAGQLVPVKRTAGGVQYWQTANKASGRTV